LRHCKSPERLFKIGVKGGPSKNERRKGPIYKGEGEPHEAFGAVNKNHRAWRGGGGGKKLVWGGPVRFIL